MLQNLELNVVNLISSTNNHSVTLTNGFSIKGTIKEKEVIKPCRVRLFEQLSGRLIYDIVTDLEGNYQFNNLNKVKFYIVAHHPESKFNAIIQDNIIPE